MTNSNRDNFTQKTKLVLAKRAGWLCSDPLCRKPTIGSNADGNGEINLGVAAHICAAAPNGPRYDPKQTTEERQSPDNGIWMCRLHGTAVDADDSKYTVELLREWKNQAQRDSLQRVVYGDSLPHPTKQSHAKSAGRTSVQSAAAADLKVFRRSGKWPLTDVPLTLTVEGFEGAVSTTAVGKAMETLDSLVLVAPPGMGKTSAVFQISDAILASENGVPIVVQLSDWAVDGVGLIEHVVKRPAFLGVSENDVRDASTASCVVLLLDGWNELDVAARRRAAAHLARLRAELPELCVLISTRKQALDVPFGGTRAELLPLNEKQQRDIAKALRAENGALLIDPTRRSSDLGVKYARGKSVV